MDEIKDLDWISAGEMNRPPRRPKAGPQIDTEVSKIVGRPVGVGDPKLLKLVVKWKKTYGSEDRVDNLLINPNFLIELKKTFNG